MFIFLISDGGVLGIYREATKRDKGLATKKKELKKKYFVPNLKQNIFYFKVFDEDGGWYLLVPRYKMMSKYGSFSKKNA